MELNGYIIAPATPADFDALVVLTMALFTRTSQAEIESDLRRITVLDKYQVFLAKIKDETVGYVIVTLRTDHVEGASTYPVGYMEAIYVSPEHRKKGIARALFDYGVAWCKERGCTEMGSDTWHWNKEAQDFHKRLGFREEDVLVHYYKKIDP